MRNRETRYGKCPICAAEVEVHIRWYPATRYQPEEYDVNPIFKCDHERAVCKSDELWDELCEKAR